MPKDQFKREVEKELTGRESEPWEIIYFKLYKTQIPVVKQAIETAALMLGTDKSRGYCLEMVCADFLAGANLENDYPTVLLQSVSRFFKFLARRSTPGISKRSYRASFVSSIRPKRPRLRLEIKLCDQLRKQVLRRDGWRCQVCGSRQNLQVHHKQFRSHLGDDDDSNLITLCAGCHEAQHRSR